MHLEDVRLRHIYILFRPSYDGLDRFLYGHAGRKEITNRTRRSKMDDDSLDVRVSFFLFSLGSRFSEFRTVTHNLL